MGLLRPPAVRLRGLSEDDMVYVYVHLILGLPASQMSISE